MEYEPILALFQGLSLYLEARTWIRIRIRIEVKGRIRIRIKVTSRIRSASKCCGSATLYQYVVPDHRRIKKHKKDHQYVLFPRVSYQIQCTINQES